MQQRKATNDPQTREFFNFYINDIKMNGSSDRFSTIMMIFILIQVADIFIVLFNLKINYNRGVKVKLDKALKLRKLS